MANDEKTTAVAPSEPQTDVPQEKDLSLSEAGQAPGDAAPTKPVSRFTRGFRSPLFNVILVGLISFTQPGIWNALNSMSTFRDDLRV